MKYYKTKKEIKEPQIFDELIDDDELYRKWRKAAKKNKRENINEKILLIENQY
jgi:hypothetical protein